MKSKQYTNGTSNAAIVSIAIGNDYLEKWEKFIFPTWALYAQRHDYSIIVYTEDLLPLEDKHYKKATWQKMLLPEVMNSEYSNITKVAYIDSDILINPYAPDIFKESDLNKINSTSLRCNLPYDINIVLRKLALLRKTYIMNDYPLDSSLFITLESLYRYHNLTPQNDEFCAGVLVFSPSKVMKLMSSWFKMYDSSINSVTNGGDQTHMNYHVQESGLYNRIDYKWQAIWSYEVANFYPFLFEDGFNDIKLFQKCIKASLFNNYFLHFAGNWPESTKWMDIDFNLSKNELEFYSNLKNYQELSLKGQPKGKISPKSDSHN